MFEICYLTKHIHACTGAHSATHPPTHAHMPARTHVHTHTHTHTHAHTHTHTHTHTYMACAAFVIGKDGSHCAVYYLPPWPCPSFARQSRPNSNKTQ